MYVGACNIPIAIASAMDISDAIFPLNISSAIFLLSSKYLIGVADKPKTLASSLLSSNLFIPLLHSLAPHL